MASHVVVIDSTARRAVVKVTPGKYLSDVLQEACKKLGLTASLYGLKNNNKQVDLSRTIRLSGLSSGAKLELALLSRSTSVVSVALQLPESVAGNVPNGRLVGKFPSTTTLWLILRKFESGAVGGSTENRNFTARATAKTMNGDSGAGRLYYETPVLQVMGREFSTFADLQKTLGQLGFNGGSTLLRLNFRATETPLEEAMAEIGQYFKSGESKEEAHSESVTHTESARETEPTDITEDQAALKSTPEPSSDSLRPEETQQAEVEDEVEENTVVGPGQRPMSVYAPPDNSTPQAARQNFNEADYEPTIDHAKTHQSRLSLSAQNKRLASEAELRAQEEAAAARLAAVSDVEIKIRYPDQSQVVSRFHATDTSATLYAFVRSTLHYEDQPFTLSFFSARGPLKAIPPDDSSLSLIRDLGLSGRVLVSLLWSPSASADARLGRPGTLKAEFAAAARELRVEDVRAVDTPDAAGTVEADGGTDKAGGSAREGGARKGVPKWLKLPGKK
ncbi:MAG: hypothetical protein M1832_003267 [Thelocarpon impressellum]|nr:MAG: hypothetical protein M1832_003267 [Thelocarpon impressellum]